MSITIGELIDKLHQANPEEQVRFSFGHTVPTVVSSWRGIYEEAAIGWADIGRNGTSNALTTVGALIAELERATDGREYYGWKGGKYTYDRSTLLHVDNPGDYSSTEIVRVEVKPWGGVTLHTEQAA